MFPLIFLRGKRERKENREKKEKKEKKGRIGIRIKVRNGQGRIVLEVY